MQIPPRETPSRSEEIVGEIPDWEEGRNIVIPPLKSAPTSMLESRVTDLVGQEIVAKIDDPAAPTPESTSSTMPAKISWRAKKAPELVVGVAEGIDGVVGGKGKAKAVESLAIVDAVEAVEAAEAVEADEAEIQGERGVVTDWSC